MTEVASAMPKPPDPIVIDDLRVVAMRPPVTPDGPWWWRGFWRDKEAKCSRAHTFGRGTRAAIRAAAMSFYNGPMHTKTPEPVVALSTVRDLLRAFKAHQRARMESGQIEVNSFEAYDYAVKHRLNYTCDDNDYGGKDFVTIEEVVLDSSSYTGKWDWGSST